MDAAIVTYKERAGRPGHEGQGMLIHVHSLVRGAVAAGRIVPGRTWILPEPDFEGVEESAVRVIRIHGDPLVVPVLGIIAGRESAVHQRSTGRAGNLSPGGATIRGPISAELTAIRIATATI